MGAAGVAVSATWVSRTHGSNPRRSSSVPCTVALSRWCPAPIATPGARAVVLAVAPARANTKRSSIAWPTKGTM